MWSPVPNQRRAAFTVWEFVIVLAALVALTLVFIAMNRPAKINRKRSDCAWHLKQISIAFYGLGHDIGEDYPMNVAPAQGGSQGATFVYQHFQVLSNELNSPGILVCPEDLHRTRARDFDSGLGDTNISYFVNLDAIPNDPTSPLAGDRHLRLDGLTAGPGLVALRPERTIGWTNSPHGKIGYVLFCDGSVRALSSPAVNQFFHQPGIATNRLQFP